MTKDVVVVIGAGGIGQAIARRQGFGKTILLADWNQETLARASAELSAASYAVVTQEVDVTSRASVAALAQSAAALGPVMQVVNTSGLSPNMARWCSRSSARSSPRAAPASSSRAWRVT